MLIIIVIYWNLSVSVFLSLSPSKYQFRLLIGLVWLVVFNVPSTARSFRDGTPIYCPLRRTWNSILKMLFKFIWYLLIPLRDLPVIYINAQHTQPDFWWIEAPENIRVNIRFLLDCFRAQNLIFYCRQKIRPTLQFYNGVSFGAHDPIILITVIVLWTKLERSHCWITSLRFFIGLKLVHTIRFFIANSWIKGHYYSSHRKFVYTIWFLLLFFVYEKKLGCVHWA